ncbi:MAG: AAA family ATPase [Thermodesulfobacterium sp.]|nr:AAA family ATPase [Thermodesulfobacterium sp.]
MKILKLKINNFRNLSDIEVDFHPDITFLVGENGYAPIFGQL